MARNGSGVYNPPSNSWNPAVAGSPISSDDWAAILLDLSLALTGSIASDGQTTTTQPIPFVLGVQITSGAQATPSLSFIGDTDTGVYRPGANQLGFVCGGVAVLTATSSGVTFPAGVSFTGQTLIPLGTAGAPSLAFTGDTNTGVYSPGADQFAIAIGGFNAIVVGVSGVSIAAGLSIAGNTTIGDAGTDTLIVAAAATFNGAFVTNSTAGLLGNNTLGATSANTLTINAVSTVNALETHVGADVVLADVAPTSVTSAGFRGAPLNTQDAIYTLLATDSGKTVYHTSGTGHAWTIPPNSTTAFAIGTTIVVRNIGSGVVTLTRGASVVLRISGSATDSNKSLAQWGMATLLKEGTDTWVVSGVGLT